MLLSNSVVNTLPSPGPFQVEASSQLCEGEVIQESLLGSDCQLQIMSSLDHPNIAKFLGVCYLPELSSLPVLLMEKLDRSLADYLDNTPNIPFPTKKSILEDIARGLVYLHKQDPPIIHRDLTARNVSLTTELQAKITAFGKSCLVDLKPGQLPTQLPGTPVYMPPEALSGAKYDTSLDIFSFGHLALFTALQV